MNIQTLNNSQLSMKLEEVYQKLGERSLWIKEQEVLLYNLFHRLVQSSEQDRTNETIELLNTKSAWEKEYYSLLYIYKLLESEMDRRSGNIA